MPRHGLSDDLQPLAAGMGVSVPRELQLPQRRVDAHDDLDGLNAVNQPPVLSGLVRSVARLECSPTDNEPLQRTGFAGR